MKPQKISASKSIPETWIKQYVDSLIAAAKLFDVDSAMRQAALDRADAVLDMVRAYRSIQSKDVFEL